MSLSGVFPVTVAMRLRPLQSPWLDSAWEVEAVTPGVQASLDEATWVVRSLALELHGDEAEAYLENWIAPAPRVFVSWHMHEGRARPMQVTVSYVEGTRMFDSGDPADGVAMPAAVHHWLGDWLALNYRQAQHKGRARHGI